MRKLFLIAIGMCLTGAKSGQAQTNISSIKSDSNYIWAEGYGTSVDEADADALQRLSSQIWTHITHSTESTGKDISTSNGTQSEETQKVFLKTFTSNSIPNARMLILKQNKSNCTVFRYVNKSDIRSMVEAKTRRIEEFIEAGRSAEKMLQLDDAMRNYYWALMLARSHTEPVYTEFGDTKVECSNGMLQKINRMLLDIKAEITDCQYVDGTYLATLKLSYEGRPVSSCSFRYFDGQSFIGPVIARNGICEIELIELPRDNKIPLIYEYRFKDKAETLNSNDDLRNAFANISAPKLEATYDIPVKVNVKKGTMKQIVDKKSNSIPKADIPDIPSEKPRQVRRIELPQLSSNDSYMDKMKLVERAIAANNPSMAKDCFTDLGWQMFDSLMTKTGKVTLSGKQSYQFVQTDNQILARPCKIKIKFSNGRSFMENIVFRFNPISQKIQTLAFMLTDIAEDNIFNAASSWSDVSRFTILQFMEDYQTAYALKRTSFLRQLFSKNAIIITGTVLKDGGKPKFQDTGVRINTKKKNIVYTQYSTEQYFQKLEQLFKKNEYYHLSYENNRTGYVNTNGILPQGAAFGIQIRQIYDSPSYSDCGYLSLILNMQEELPRIEVRLWQPEDDYTLDYQDFLKKFQIK